MGHRSSEKFCLRWNDFESNISGAFRELREEKDFFDVTLACDDEDHVDAHRVILSACSPFFRYLILPTSDLKILPVTSAQVSTKNLIEYRIRKRGKL